MPAPFASTSTKPRPPKSISTDALTNMRAQFTRKDDEPAVNVANIAFQRELILNRSKKKQPQPPMPQFSRLKQDTDSDARRRRLHEGTSTPRPRQRPQAPARPSSVALDEAAAKVSFWTPSRCWGLVAATGLLLIVILLCTGTPKK